MMFWNSTVTIHKENKKIIASLNAFGDMVSIDNGSYRFKEDLEVYGFINRHGEIEYLADGIRRDEIDEWIASEDEWFKRFKKERFEEMSYYSIEQIKSAMMDRGEGSREGLSDLIRNHQSLRVSDIQSHLVNIQCNIPDEYLGCSDDYQEGYGQGLEDAIELLDRLNN